MLLFIFESIGTSELLLIGVVALIFLGPRKLPQMAKTIGKSMAEFRRATNEFKATWEREVDFENDDSTDLAPAAIAREAVPAAATTAIEAPEIREADPEAVKQMLSPKDAPPTEPPAESDKRSWL
jgi:Tat protein translocase TatB subunit